MNTSFKEQLNQLLNCDLKTTFPTARAMERKLYFFVGPTNSGKTYAANQELLRADCGIYLAPLRLLALENYEFLKENGRFSSLITGEEEIFHEDSTHICSTIEMINFELETDVCVIDEIQMLEDEDRGWAWVNAILGAPASKVIMTGSVNALDAIKQIAKYLDEPLEIVKFKRKNPLKMLDLPTPLRDLKAGSALIAFSRKDVLGLKAKLSKHFKVSVLYGNLSPEVRKEEARRFREKETQILIATDAIAMGLNLPIEQIIFTTDQKFDGITMRPLTPNEVIQIAGRAGRYGHHEIGYVGATKESILEHIDTMFHSPLRTIKPPFKVKATIDQISSFASHLQTADLTKILKFFLKNMRFSGPFVATNIQNMLDLAILLDTKTHLKLEEKYILSSAPTNTKSPLLRDAYLAYVRAVIEKKPVPYRLMISLKHPPKTELELLKAEDEVKKISLYLWLSYKFPTIFFDTINALKMRIAVNQYCENSLQIAFKREEYQGEAKRYPPKSDKNKRGEGSKSGYKNKQEPKRDQRKKDERSQMNQKRKPKIHTIEKRSSLV